MSNPTEHLLNAVESAAQAFVGVPRSIIDNKAEEQAELYVSSTLGLEDGFHKEIVKDQFKNMFIDKMKWSL